MYRWSIEVPPFIATLGAQNNLQACTTHPSVRLRYAALYLRRDSRILSASNTKVRGEPCSAGTFAGVVEKLDYLEELGVNAIELLPVHEFNELEYYEVLEYLKEEATSW